MKIISIKRKNLFKKQLQEMISEFGVALDNKNISVYEKLMLENSIDRLTFQVEDLDNLFR